MLPSEFIHWLDDISVLKAYESGSKAYKKAFSSLKKDMEITPLRFNFQSRRWHIAFLVSLAIGLLCFIGLIALTIWGGSGEPRRFSDAESTLVWWMLGLFLFSDAVDVIAHIKSERICDKALQSSIDRLWIRMQEFSPAELKHAQAVYQNDIDIEAFENPHASNELCGCFHCRRIFPIKDFDWNHNPAYPKCPHCQSEKHLVYSGKNAALTRESLSILHTLFIEE